MRYLSSICLVIFALHLSATTNESANKGIKISASEESATKKTSTQETTSQESITQTTKNFVPSLSDLWGDSAADFEEIFKSERPQTLLDMDEAVAVLRDKIINRRPDQAIDLASVFTELRNIFSETQFSTEELIVLIDDAVELKKKYLLIFDFVIRSGYARRAVQEGLDAEEVLQFASSEYIQLPSFILKTKVDNYQLNEVLTDLGCGTIWKDRAKYLFILNKYFGKTGKQTNDATNQLALFPRRIRNYLRLLEEIDGFFGEAYEHLVYLIAQDFYYAEIPQGKIMKIFSFSEKEWNALIEPIKSRNL